MRLEEDEGTVEVEAVAKEVLDATGVVGVVGGAVGVMAAATVVEVVGRRVAAALVVDDDMLASRCSCKKLKWTNLGRGGKLRRKFVVVYTRVSLRHLRRSVPTMVSKTIVEINLSKWGNEGMKYIENSCTTIHEIAVR